VETFFGELTRQLIAVRRYHPDTAAAVAAVIRAVSVERGFEWVDLTGPAVQATCRALGITRVSARNLDAFVFNNE